MAEPEIALDRFLKRISLGSDLSSAECEAILGLKVEVQEVPLRFDLVRPGETVEDAILVASGMLARYDLMSDGGRQITALHVPGDLCDLHSVVAPTTGWGIAPLGRCTIVRIRHADLRDLCRRFPNIAMAFWQDTALDASILSKSVANMGRKDARGRIAHLLLELGIRLEAAGIANRHHYGFPVTQEQIAEITGMTAIHVNRMLQELRAEQLCVIEQRQVRIFDWPRLRRLADFDTAYLLHLAMDEETTVHMPPRLAPAANLSR